MNYQVSGRQLVKLHALLGDVGVVDRGEKLRLVSACLYRPVASTKDLTWHEASIVILTLDSLAQVRDGRAEAMARLIRIAERRMAAAT